MAEQGENLKKVELKNLDAKPSGVSIGILSGDLARQLPDDPSEKDLPLIVSKLRELSTKNKSLFMELNALKEANKQIRMEMQAIQEWRQQVVKWAKNFSNEVNQSLHIIEQGLNTSAEDQIAANKEGAAAMLQTLQENQQKLGSRVGFIEQLHVEEIQDFRQQRRQGG